MGNIIHSAYHKSLEDEIKRLRENLIKAGIEKPSRIEITALIAYKNQRAVLSIKEVNKFIMGMRGMK